MCPIYSRRWPPPPRITPPLPQQDWYADGVPMDRTQAATALKNQFELEKQMSNALNQLNSGSLTDLKATLLSAQSNVGELSQYFSHKFRQHSHFYNERRAEDSTTACKVFDIPELLEMVLQYLDVTDVLSIYQCSRNIRDSIDRSSQLQQQLSLRAAPVNSHLHFPLRNLTHDLFGHPSIGFSTQEHIVQGRRRSLHERKADPIDDPTAEVHACFYLLSGQVLPGVGSRIRKMFITQPPIEEMYISLDCCPSYEYPDYAFAPQPSTPVREIVKKGGLTVGDLYDRTKKLLDEHRYCPSAYSGLIQDDGSVRVGVRFVGKMTLQPDDPLILDWQKQQRKREDDDREYHNKTAKFEAFCNAKRNANANGEPMPTLKEFVALHGEDADWQTLAYPPSTHPFAPYPHYLVPPLGAAPSSIMAGTTTQPAANNDPGPSTQAGASISGADWLDSLDLDPPENGD